MHPPFQLFSELAESIEILGVDRSSLLSGDIGALERRDYPEPLVNHKTQQAKFKALYATIRS